MPTSGLDDQFVDALSDLETILQTIKESHGAATLIFIRGDMNASSKNLFRSSLLNNFLEKHDLKRIKTEHPLVVAQRGRLRPTRTVGCSCKGVQRGKVIKLVPCSCPFLNSTQSRDEDIYPKVGPFCGI